MRTCCTTPIDRRARTITFKIVPFHSPFVTVFYSPAFRLFFYRPTVLREPNRPFWKRSNVSITIVSKRYSQNNHRTVVLFTERDKRTIFDSVFFLKKSFFKTLSTRLEFDNTIITYRLKCTFRTVSTHSRKTLLFAGRFTDGVEREKCTVLSSKLIYHFYTPSRFARCVLNVYLSRASFPNGNTGDTLLS